MTKLLLTGLLGAVIASLVVGCTTGDEQSRSAQGGDRSASGLLDASVECMRDRGWEIVILDDESWHAPGVSETQYAAYVADTNECREQNEVIEEPEEVPDERWQKAYADTVTSAQCLRDQGYDIPETPSFQAWKDSYFADGGSRQWVPWGFVPVPSMSGDEFTRLEAICPQVSL